MYKFYSKYQIFLYIIIFFFGFVQGYTQPIVTNHLNTNYLQIPDSVITQVKNNYKMLYAHLSHGWQVEEGLNIIETNNPFYDYEWGNYSLPNVSNALCMMYYYGPSEAYWRGNGPNTVRGYLNSHPTINVSMFSFCRDLDTASTSFVQAYLNTLSMLENEYPNVTFVYFTGNAQKNGLEGYTRHQNNEMIRQYCQQNNKVLFDFADLDCWRFNDTTQVWEQETYLYNGQTVPVEHPKFAHEITHHTTYESCEQKGKAIWWLLSEMSGWSPSTTNISPIAINDSASTIENTPVVIDILVNDYDPDGSLNPSSVYITTNPTNGVISVNSSNGQVTYTPNSSYSGTDLFKYTVEDNSGAVSNEATATINIYSVNVPPIAVNDTSNTDEDIPAVIDILANDYDPDGSIVPSSVVITNNPANGGLSVNSSNGRVTYAPNAGFNGLDVFRYTVEDNNGSVSNEATVTIIVNAVNHSPVVISHISDVFVFEDSGDTVLVDDLNTIFFDSDYDVLSFSAVSDSGIALNVNGDSLSFYPLPDFFGTVELRVTASDGQLSVSDTAFINIINVNDPPQAFNLLDPINGDTLNSISSPVCFYWNSSHDVDNNVISYIFYISNGMKDTTINNITDTLFYLQGNNFWHEGTIYNWTATVCDSQYYVPSLDTFVLILPLINSISGKLSNIPKTYSLTQNFPNPFNPTTTIQFGLPEAGFVEMDILDIRGRFIKRIVNQYTTAGYHLVNFEVGNLATGVYFYKINIPGKYQNIHKMIILK